MQSFPLGRIVADLLANLLAGARLALGLSVTPARFRFSPGQFALLFATNLVVGLVGGILRDGTPGGIDFGALPTLLMQVPLMLLAALLIARFAQRPEVLVELAIVWIAGDWIFEIALVAIVWLAAGGDDALLPAWIAGWLPTVYIVWALVVLLRGTRMLCPSPRGLVVRAGAVVVALFAVFLLFVPKADLWIPDPEQPEPEEGSTLSSILDEDVFHLQSMLLAEAATKLAPERPGVTDLYFVGFAATAAQDVFLNEVTAVRRLFEDRFDAFDRSLVLVNNRRTLREQPIASTTNLRAALGMVGETMDRDDDVLVLFLTSHGTQDHRFSIELEPLRLQQLTPIALARMLQASGVKWKVIVVSACYSGGFVEPLRDANTVVITASDANNPSFGCENGRDWTYFGEAFFRDALAGTRSILEAFDNAKAAVAAREAREGLNPSNPQMHVGVAIRDKLRELEARLARGQ